MSEANVRKELKIIMSGLNMPNAQALRGKSIGEFNKSFPGAADISVVKQIAEELVAGL